MRSCRYQEHIARTPEQVFAFMMDFRNAPRWRSLVRSIELVGSGPVAHGSQVLVTMDVMGKVKQTISEIWCFDPPRRVGFRNTDGGFTGHFEYVLEPEPGGTLVTFSVDIRPHGLMWLVLPLVLKSHRVRYEEQLRRLKTVIEQP